MIVTFEMLYQQNQQILSLLNKLLCSEAASTVEEVSLDGACRILNKGSRTVKKYVKSGHLKARVEIINTPKRGRTERLFFRISDIKEFQDQNRYIPPVKMAAETAAHLAVDGQWSKDLKKSIHDSALQFKKNYGVKKW